MAAYIFKESTLIVKNRQMRQIELLIQTVTLCNLWEILENFIGRSIAINIAVRIIRPERWPLSLVHARGRLANRPAPCLPSAAD